MQRPGATLPLLAGIAAALGRAAEHRGREAIEAFLKDFVAAGIQGEIVEWSSSGCPGG